MSDCFVLYLLLTCMKKKTSGADKFTNNRQYIEQKYPGYLLNDDLDITPAKETSRKCKQIRQETCDVRSMLQDALSHEFQEHKVEFTVFAEYYQLI